MSNDWNLKNDCLVIVDELKRWGYDIKGIEILRKKLIEDMEDYFAGWGIDLNIVKSIINRRFGVKDNAKSKR